MPTLKCTKCNQESKVGFITTHKSTGTTGVNFGFGKTLKVFPVWPFVISLVADCPNCKEKTKLLVVASKKTKIITILILIVVLSLSALFVFNGHNQSMIVKQSGGAGILISECADKSYITKTADYIIEGTIEKVESSWNTEKTLIFTYSDFKIGKYDKGTPFTEDKLQIVTEGGEVGEIGQWVEDQPIFHQGKKVRIYFQGTDGEFSIVCGQMGTEEINL